MFKKIFTPKNFYLLIFFSLVAYLLYSPYFNQKSYPPSQKAKMFFKVIESSPEQTAIIPAVACNDFKAAYFEVRCENLNN